MELGVEAFAPVVAIGGEVQAQPVPAADDGGGQVHAREPGREGRDARVNQQGNGPCRTRAKPPARLRPHFWVRLQPGPIGNSISAHSHKPRTSPWMKAQILDIVILLD